jgi:quercetin dioxygenase-like cupin family protein
VRPDPAFIAEYLVGHLSEQERNDADALMAASPSLRREVDEAAEALALAAEALPPLPPSPSARARLVDALGGVDRFAPFLDDLTRLFELPAAAIRGLLARIDGQEWETAVLGVPLQGAELFHFAVGPNLAATGAAGGVLRLRPEVVFPQHSHHGNETTFVLEGGYCVDGRVHGPGSTIEMSAGSQHDYRSAPGRDLVLMVLHRGITIVTT